MTQFRPLNSYIQVAPIMPETRVGSIYLAGAAQPQPTRGKVIAMGEGKTRPDLTVLPMPKINVGDIVAFTSGSLQAVKSTEGTIYLIEAETLLGVEQ
jgi:co-chaperonin GroES (HSP10)